MIESQFQILRKLIRKIINKTILSFILILLPLMSFSNTCIFSDKEKVKNVLKTEIVNEITVFLENDYENAEGDKIYETFRFYENNFRFKEPFDKVIDLFQKDTIVFTSYYIIIYTKYHDFTGPFFSIRAFNDKTGKGKEFSFEFFKKEQKLKDYKHNSEAFNNALKWDYKTKYSYFTSKQNDDLEPFVHSLYEWVIIIYNSSDIIKTKTFYKYTTKSMLYFMDVILNFDKVKLKQYFDNMYEMINYD